MAWALRCCLLQRQGSSLLGSTSWVHELGGFWFLVSGVAHGSPWFLVSGFWLLGSGFWFLISGFWFDGVFFHTLMSFF